ncbi:Hypothetical protein A7982_06669 [Minicystis rosea]|nr:Hypothetical protein A7982_06669 [Minicystis rosea]
MHAYELTLTWEGNEGTGTSEYTRYGRRFRVAMAGKPDLAGSADAAFRGDPSLHNPEDLLLAAVASCHMLSYLALCARGGVRVVAYADTAHGELEVEPRGGGRFRAITLRPRVTVASGADVERATALHALAHERCFIASSCNFPIACEPKVLAGGAS